MTGNSSNRAIATVAAVMLCLRVTPTLACASPPADMYIPHEEAIAAADWIARVRAHSIDRDGDRSVYTLDVLEYLKGDGPDTIEIETSETGRARDDESYPAEANYYGHRASEFWRGYGRSFNLADCRVHPEFLFNNIEYLVFGDREYSVGYENITGQSDLWYQFVRDTVGGGGSTARPFPVSAESYFRSAAAIVRITATWTGSAVAIDTQILKGPDLPYAHMIHVSPEAYYAGLLNPVCQPDTTSFRRPRRERIDTLLVFEFLPEDHIYHSESIQCEIEGRDGSGSIWAVGAFSRTGHRRFAIRDDHVQIPRGSERWPPTIQGAEEISLDALRSILDAQR
jgi:hypothetical protein